MQKGSMCANECVQASQEKSMAVTLDILSYWQALEGESIEEVKWGEKFQEGIDIFPKQSLFTPLSSWVWGCHDARCMMGPET